MDDLEGIWVVYSYDVGPIIHWIHWSEVRAHRYQRELGYGSVKFWPFGTEWSD